MEKSQLKNSGILVFSSLAINLTGFFKQMILAWALGLSGKIDLLLLAMIIPAIIQSMIGGGAGEVLVIKREKEGFRNGSFEALYIFSCLLPVIITGLLYYWSLNMIVPFFNISADDLVLFKGLSIIFILNMVPGTFSSVLRPHLFSRGFYMWYAVTTALAQATGLLFLLLSVEKLGIWSFALFYLITNCVNAFMLSFKADLYLKGLLITSVWKHEAEQLLKLFRRVMSLSIQSLATHLSTFWERTISVKYLSQGYLSSLNYAKSIAELPNTILLSSVLTTTYMEQVRLHKKDYGEFERYTAQVLQKITLFGFMLQIFMLIIAPVIIILVFRRGKFDNDAVQITLVIFNILLVGVLPRMVMNFFARTMYILGEYRKLLITVIIKTIIQIVLMVALINYARHVIPFSIILGFFIASITYFSIMRKWIKLPSLYKFLGKLIIVSVLSVALLIMHTYTIPLYIDKSNVDIFLLALPLIIMGGFVMLFALYRNGVLVDQVKYFKSMLWKS